MQQKIKKEIKRHIKSNDFNWIARNALKFSAAKFGRRFNRPFAPPMLAGLMVTYRCNLLCLFCEYPLRGDIKKELKTDDFIGVINELHEMGTPAIGFAGGDPVLRKDIWTLVRTASDLGMTTSLGSNGTFWKKETVEEMFTTNLNLVGFSLESPEPKLHDYLQDSNGAWGKVCNTIRMVDDYRKTHNKNICISVSVNFNFKNLNDMTRMPEFAQSLGADQVNFIGMETGAIKENEKNKDLLKVTDRDIKETDRIVDKLIEMKKKTNIIDNSIDSLMALKYQTRGKPLPVNCHAGYTSLYVDCYGNIYSCMAFMENGDLIAGDYEKGKLKSFWYSKQYNEYRKENLDSCHSCYWPCQNEMNYMLNSRKYIPGIKRFQNSL